MSKAEKLIQEAQDLNNQIEKCREDHKAIALQERLVDMLLNNFNDEEFLNDLAILKQRLDESKKIF